MKRVKDQLLSDTIPINDQESNEQTLHQRRLIRRQVRINNRTNSNITENMPS